jgi:gamma-glutamyltranspeptidase/glutathione hydrolase
MSRFAPSLALTLILGTATSALAQEAADTVAPEAGAAATVIVTSPEIRNALAAKNDGKPVEAKTWMVAAANPLAVEAGAKALRNGGSAADAMVAVQAVLGLVEPQSSGLGGGAFLVWYDAASGQVTTLDGRETAPLAATPTLFQDENGEPLKFFDAVVGGRSVGTPGTPMLMEEAHKRWGKAEWGSLFDDAITLAEEGFPVSTRLAELVAGDAERLSRFETTANYFLPGGAPLREGIRLQNPAYAETLQDLAADGASAFYSGPVADAIVETVRNVQGNPGVLSLADFDTYDVVERPAVCAPYLEYEICGMGPPSSGALTVGQILGIVGNFALDTLGPDDPESWRLIGDASRLAFADRGRYMADSDFVPVPVKGLIDPAYLEERAGLIEGDRTDPGKALENAARANRPTTMRFCGRRRIDRIALDQPHLDRRRGRQRALDDDDNRERLRLAPDGERLSAQQRTDRLLIPLAQRRPAGRQSRRTRQTSALLHVADHRAEGRQAGAGNRLAGRQPHHRLCRKAIIAHLTWGMDIQQAVAMPHYVNRFGTYDLEEGTDAASMRPDLEQMGYEVNVRDLNSGLHGIAITTDGLEGGADPRREGIALGE